MKVRHPIQGEQIDMFDPPPIEPEPQPTIESLDGLNVGDTVQSAVRFVGVSGTIVGFQLHTILDCWVAMVEFKPGTHPYPCPPATLLVESQSRSDR